MKIEKRIGLNGVLFVLTSGEDELTVSSDKLGIFLSGRSPTIEDKEDLRLLAKTIGDAYTHHTQLKKKIRSKIMENSQLSLNIPGIKQ
jgi:hypothetical protein